MLDNLYEMNRILLAVTELGVTKKGASEISVINVLNGDAVNAAYANHVGNILACSRIGIVRRTNDRMFITKKGQEFFGLRTIENGKTNIDLNEAQKGYLLELLVDSVYYKPILDRIISDFQLDFTQKIWFYDLSVPKNVVVSDLMKTLFQVGILVTKRNRIELCEEKNDFLSRIRHKTKRSEEQLAEILRTQKVTGDAAEDLTLEYEKNRLRREGYEYLSLAIHRISNEDVCAGYDIISYNGKNSSLEHDRFIEVKGTTGKSPTFFWSRNEVETAKKLGKQYWIYLWTEVNSALGAKLYKMIHDPYDVFFRKSATPPETVLYSVELR